MNQEDFLRKLHLAADGSEEERRRVMEEAAREEKTLGQRRQPPQRVDTLGPLTDASRHGAKKNGGWVDEFEQEQEHHDEEFAGQPGPDKDS